ncbi:MAG: dUTP diphosphatase [Alphaproteobacteria bacterium]|nr:dUTP diphosphatase [Alphaproteobacteria bacterium]
MSFVSVAIVKLPHAEGLDLPAYATEHSAGMDIYAAVKEDVILAPGERKLIPTGLSIALPEGYEAQVRPRSGLALKNGIAVLNSPGTIDADYRGEVQIILANLGSEAFTIKRGMRIAQMVIAPYSRVLWQQTDSLSETKRGSGGFGSTGTGS